MLKHLMITTLALLLLLSRLRSYVFAECNVCSAVTNQACVSETDFTFCTNGIPGAVSYKCPEGRICSTIGNNICQDGNDENSIRSCQDCFKCDATRTFACTGQSSFALCLGTNNYSLLYTGNCAANSYCSIDYSHICGTHADLVFPTCPPVPTVAPTVPTTSTTTPAPTPSPANPSAYCQYIQETGRFPMGSNLATTCHQYIHCYNVSSTWTGASYVCPGNSYFDSSTKLCTTNIPPRCSNNVRSFALLDIQLD